MKYKLMVLALLLFSHTDIQINASNDDKNNLKKNTTLIEHLNNLEKKLAKDDLSLEFIKKYTLNGLYNEKTRNEIRELCNRLEFPEEWFYKLVNLESNGNPQAVNAFTNATGLIQFMPATAKALGTSTEALYKMSVSEQLPWVELYLSKVKKNKQFGSFLDLYFAVFYPKGIGKPLDYVIGSEISLEYAKKVQNQNKGIDKAGNNDGLLTPNDIKEWIS